METKNNQDTENKGLLRFLVASFLPPFFLFIFLNSDDLHVVG